MSRSGRLFWLLLGGSSHCRLISCHGPLHERASGHPQIAQRKQRHQLSRILGQPFVAYLGKTELAFDDAKRMLHFGPHTGLELFGLVQQGAPHCLFVQCPAFTRAHNHMPGITRSFWSPDRSLVGRIGKHRQDSCLCNRPCSRVTSLTLAAVPMTLWTRPDSVSAPM